MDCMRRGNAYMNIAYEEFWEDKLTSDVSECYLSTYMIHLRQTSSVELDELDLFQRTPVCARSSYTYYLELPDSPLNSKMNLTYPERCLIIRREKSSFSNM